MPWCISRCATTSRAMRPRSAAATSGFSPPRFPAVTAISSSSSAPAVAERLYIDDVGHRGDGVTHAEGRSLFVPYTLGGETVEVGPAVGHPERRTLLRVETASAERIAP